MSLLCSFFILFCFIYINIVRMVNNMEVYINKNSNYKRNMWYTKIIVINNQY